MASTREIRGRIRSFGNTRKITKAMELVAGSRLKRAEARLIAARPYFDLTLRILGDVAEQAGALEIPLLTRRPVHAIGLIVMGSDRGLAGAYNANVLRTATHLAHEKVRVGQVKVISLGKKIVSAFTPGSLQDAKLPEYEVLARFQDLPAQPTAALAREIAGMVLTSYGEEGVDEVQLVFTRYLSALNQRPAIQQLLPVDLAATIDQAPFQAAKRPRGVLEFEPSPDEIMRRLLPELLTTLVYRGLLESAASEFAARRLAMNNATDAAGDLIDQLRLQYNRARQAAITKQISEIVGGAEALAES